MRKPLKLQPKTREQWLELKKKRYGGSEGATLMGLNRWQSPRDIFLEKTGQSPPKEMSFLMKCGVYLEDGVVKLFEDESGYRVIKSSAADNYYLHPDYPELIGGTPDRIIVMPDKTKAVLEIKTTSSKFDHDNYPDSWYVQVQIYMGLTGLKNSIICWFQYHSIEIQWVEVEFNEEMYKHIIKSIVDFHNNHVLTGIEPPATCVNDVLNLYPRQVKGLKVQATETIEKYYTEIIQMKAAIKPYEDKIEEYKDAVKLAMADAETFVSGDETLFTWKADKDKEVFDVTAFKSDYPELCVDYLVTKPGSRRFAVK